jgi:predicted dehydrogenase
VEALVDTDERQARRCARRYSIKHYFSSIGSLLDSASIDAISICTPPNTHADIAIEALRKGVHVLCEKPLADSSEACVKMIDAAERMNKTLMVGFNRRFRPEYQKVKQYIDSGKMGRTYLGEYWSLQSSPLVGWSKSPWYYKRGLGGCLLDQGPHMFDILNWFMGTPKSIHVRSIATPFSPVDECCTATIEYEDGGIGVGMASWMANVELEKLGIHGTGRTLYASPNFLYDLNNNDILELSLWKTATTMLSGRVKRVLAGTPRTNTYQMEIDHFINCIRTGTKPVTDGRSGLTTLCQVEAALSSLRNGASCPVVIPQH